MTVEITDEDGLTVPTSNNSIHFEIEGSGEIVATDKHERNSFNGKALVIVRPIWGEPGKMAKNLIPPIKCF
ncbi:hypothetical protein [Autumnicola musiva]|uniref:hypothetical protein n=1 Tax=Autumnicola musiva TaxID=3075589 RepID=UPI003D770778